MSDVVIKKDVDELRESLVELTEVVHIDEAQESLPALAVARAATLACRRL